MTARRVMGIETEYGVSAAGDPVANPMLLSGQVVNAYAAPLGAKAGRARPVTTAPAPRVATRP